MSGIAPNRLAGRTGISIILSALVLFAGISSASAETAFYSGKPAKYVFFFIGDGVGLAQRAAAAAYAKKPLIMNTLPAQGVTRTEAANRYITGSAAAVTALACGEKTDINRLGVTPKLEPIKSIAEMAKEKGMKVGVISDVSLDHATPAGFYAHVKHRKLYYPIAVQLARSGFDFFGGGGLVDPDNLRTKWKPYVGDARALMKQNGYRFVADKDEFTKLKKGDGKIYARNKRLQDHKACPYTMDMTDEDITLPEFTAKAIELLDNDAGFFIMVEGGKIDWACHANDAVATIRNTLSFDRAVNVAVEFAKKRPNETLIVVTGDHECGGLSLGYAGMKYETAFEVLKNQKVSFQKFTDEVLKAYKKACRGECSFEALKPIITENFGLKFDGDPNDPAALTPYEIERIEAALVLSLAGRKIRPHREEDYLLYGNYDPLTVTLTRILNNKAGIGWTSYVHTGVPVITSAMGVGQEIFNGSYDNTDVAKKIMSVMGIKPEAYLKAEEARTAER